jgi:hypothetical protein
MTTPTTCVNPVGYRHRQFLGATNFGVRNEPTPWRSGFNGDGTLDLAVADLTSFSVSVLLNTCVTTCAALSFGAATDFNVGTTPVSVAVGDLNADGKLDLAVANADSNNVSILLGTGTGSFAAATNFAVGTRPLSVRLGL